MVSETFKFFPLQKCITIREAKSRNFFNKKLTIYLKYILEIQICIV